MNNDPANIAVLLRSVILYGVCVTLAIIIGVLMTNPLTYAAFGFVGALSAILFLPILLKWHHPLMIFCWNTPIVVFFIKGDPKLCLVMIAMSLTISITERALSQKRFINVPQITWPLLTLIGVVLMTAKLTGGFGLKAFGSEVYGGKKYVFLVVAILGYFALTSRPIPLKWAKLFVSLYFLGGALSCIADFWQIAPGFLKPVFWLIPPMTYDPNGIELGSTRFIGTAWGATAFVSFLIARYGIRGIFQIEKLWRPFVFFISIFLIFFGGFRSALFLTAFVIILQFFLEGLHRTRLLPILVIIVIGCMAAIIPLSSKLPYTFQRTLAFLPEDVVHLSSDARLDAQGSLDWRVNMWEALMPQIPKHLLLGKGYAISTEDMQMMGNDAMFKSEDAGTQGLAISGDYHNGPLSVILPFGIWGVIAFGWFLIASNRVMYRNYRYCIPELKTLNTFLFSTYVIATIDFLFLFGSLSDGMSGFAGLLGLSVCLNRGVCRVPARPIRKTIPFQRFAPGSLQHEPALQRRPATEHPL